MARYIDAEKLLKDMEFVTNDTTCPLHIAATIDQTISLAPTADVVEVKHGEWVDDGDCFHCSVCNRTYHLGSLQTIYDVRRCWNYCANCGARMDGRM